jgi:FkbM family methyltransferase
MIPKLVHRVWFGPNPIPGEYERWWHAWQRQWPDHEFVTWTDAEVSSLALMRAKIAEAEGYPRKADIARYEILLENGGVYLDCDIKPLQYQNFSESDAPLIVCNEDVNEAYCSIGFIAAEKDNPLLQTICETVNLLPINVQPPNKETGPYFFGKMLKAGPHQKLPPAAFYPYLYDEPYAAMLGRSLAQTIGIHVWGGSWLSKEEHQRASWQKLLRGDIAEVRAALAKINGRVETADMGDAVMILQTIRESAMEVIDKSFLCNTLSLQTSPHFELIKTCDYLLEKTPQAMVWQIGAADGILVDPIRPMLVNHDPAALLLEPNPYLFALLKQNYGRNRNLTALNNAYGAKPGRLTINCVNPEKVVAQGLPHWALGISSSYSDRNAIGGLTVTADVKGRIEQCIEKIDADIITCQQLLEAGGGRSPDILVIDAEGMDAIILKDILEHGVAPRIIQYENQCLPPEEIEAVNALLAGKYITMPFGNDTVAYRIDFLLEYCRAIFVNHGIQTIFRDSLRIMYGG